MALKCPLSGATLNSGGFGRKWETLLEDISAYRDDTYLSIYTIDSPLEDIRNHGNGDHLKINATCEYLLGDVTQRRDNCWSVMNRK